MSVMDIQRIPKKTCCDGEVLSMMVLWFCDRCSTEDARDDYRRGKLRGEESGNKASQQEDSAAMTRSLTLMVGWLWSVSKQDA
jgi:hypothetical protein